MAETQSGYRLVIGAMNLTDELLEISKAGDGSAVEFYQRVAWMPGVGRSAVEQAVSKNDVKNKPPPGGFLVPGGIYGSYCSTLSGGNHDQVVGVAGSEVWQVAPALIG